MADEDFCWDPWTVRKLETDDMGHENWDDEDAVDYQSDEDDDDDGVIEDVEEEDDDDDDDE